MIIKIKNMTLATLYIILFFVMCMPAVLSCATVQHQVSSPKIKHTSVPVESFAFIEITKDVKPAGCAPQKKIKECEEFAKGLPIVSTKSTGSGILMSHKNRHFVWHLRRSCKPRHRYIRGSSCSHKRQRP